MDPTDITDDTHRRKNMSTHGRRRLCVRSHAAASHGKSKIASNPPEAGRVKEEFS